MKSSDKRDAKYELYKKARGHCAYCGKQIAYVDATLDHYMPKSLGGTNRRGNLRLSCKPCNAKKGDMSPSEWTKILYEEK